MRIRPRQHLSQDGVTLARKIGSNMGPFARVVTSTVPRAYETAIAMGFAVDEQLDELAILPEGFEDEAPWDAGFTRFAQVRRESPNGVLAQFSQRMLELHQEIIRFIPNDSRVLVISHGGIVEASALGCAPFEAYEEWGPACSYCEGVRFYFEGIDCKRVELLRVSRSAPVVMPSPLKPNDRGLEGATGLRTSRL